MENSKKIFKKNQMENEGKFQEKFKTKIFQEKLLKI